MIENQGKTYQMSLQQVENDKKQQKKPKKLKYCCLRQGCQSIENYVRLNRIHEGTYGVVYRARQQNTNQIVAIKKLKLNESSDFPITSLREISILRTISHENIIKINKVCGTQSRQKVYIVMEYMEHEMKEFLKENKFTETQVRRLMKDLLLGMECLHQKNIVHRDLKTSNLLYSNEGILKICDFGLARRVSQQQMTQQVISLWYRPPELLLDSVNYSLQVDIWSIGCIFAEFILGQALFQGSTQLEQLDTIFRYLGSPTNQSWPNYKELKNSLYIVGNKYPQNRIRQIIPKEKLSNQGLDLLKKLLYPFPKKRITAEKALKHDWFKGQMSERDKMPSSTPINEIERIRKKVKRD